MPRMACRARQLASAVNALGLDGAAIVEVDMNW